MAHQTLLRVQIQMMRAGAVQTKRKLSLVEQSKQLKVNTSQELAATPYLAINAYKASPA